MRSRLAGVGGFVVLIGAAIGVMVFLHERDPGNQAEAHVSELVRTAHSGAKPEVSLAALDAVITGDEWASLTDATRSLVGAEVVRLSVTLVPTPFTLREIDDANRVVARYRTLPDGGRHGAARDAMIGTLEGWLGGLKTANDREARIALLGLELAVAEGNDTTSIATRLATERLEMARAIEEAWPVDALGFLAEEPRDPNGVPEAGKILARLVEQPALLVDAGTDVDAWLVSVPADDPQRKAVEAQRELGRATKAEDDAESDAAQMVAKLAKRPWDQWLVVRLASADLGTGDIAAAEKRLKALGAPGLMIRDATFLLGRVALAQGQLEEADQLMSGLLGSRLQRFLAANARLESAAKFAQDRLVAQLRSPNPPADLQRKVEAAPEAERGAIVQAWLVEAMNSDPEIQNRRAVLMTYGEVVPASIAAGTIKLRRAQALGGAPHDAMLADAERAFLAVRTAATGQPEFHLGLGEIYARLGKTAESDAELAGVLDRKDPELELRVAQVYRAIGNEKRAIDVAKHVQATPGNAPAIQQLAAAVLSVMAKSEDEREAWLRKADPHSPSVKTGLLEIEGRRLMQRGKRSECDKKFAEAARLTLKDALPTDHVAHNNAALATQQRFQCTGDIAMLRQAEAALETAYRGATDQPILIANLAGMLRTNADLRVLAKRVDVAALRLTSDEASSLVQALLAGPDRAALLAELEKDAGWRRSAELFEQYAVLAPASPMYFYDAFDRVVRTRDPAMARTFIEKLLAAKTLDTSAANEALARRRSGSDDAEREARLVGDAARDDEILAGKLDAHTRAAALFRQADSQNAYGVAFNHPDLIAGASAARREAVKLWPSLSLRTAITLGLVDEAGNSADGAGWAKLRRDRGAATALAKLVAAKDPLAAKILAAPSWTAAITELRTLGSRPDIDDLVLARLVGDATVIAWASAVKQDVVARTKLDATARFIPDDPSTAEMRAILDEN